MTESPKGAKRRQKNAAKKVRDLAIRSEAAAGVSHAELEGKYGLGRHQISKILNSDETKELLKNSEDRVKRMIERALDALEDSLGAAMDGGNRLKAALSVLKNFGLIRDSVDINHRFPKPLVIKRQDGSEVVLGTEADVKEKE